MYQDLLQHHVAQVECVLVKQDIQAKNAQAVCWGITSLDPIATVRFFLCDSWLKYKCGIH